MCNAMNKHWREWDAPDPAGRAYRKKVSLLGKCRQVYHAGKCSGSDQVVGGWNPDGDNLPAAHIALDQKESALDEASLFLLENDTPGANPRSGSRTRF